MLIIDSFKEYLNKTNSEYANIPQEELDKICKSTFSLVKESIRRGDFIPIRLQYFGIFEPMPKRIKYSKANLIKKFDNGLISKEKFENRLEILNKYKTND